MGARDGSAGMDRRRFVTGAATVAWATPLVLTLGAADAYAQGSPGACLGATNRPNGCPCSTSNQCTSGCCCDGAGPAPTGCVPAGDCTIALGDCL